MPSGIDADGRVPPRRAVLILLVSAAFLVLGVAAATVLAATTTLQVSRSGSGSGHVTSSPPGIDCPSDCSEDYDPANQTSVELRAAADSDSTFDGWDGDCKGGGTCTVVMNQSRSVTASFGGGPGPGPRPSPTPSPSASATASPQPSPTPTPTPGPPARYTISYSRVQDIVKQKGTLRAAVTPKRDGYVRGTCSARFGKRKFACVARKVKVVAGKRKILALRFDKDDYDAIVAALRKGRSVKATLVIRVSAPGRSSSVTDRQITLTISE